MHRAISVFLVILLLFYACVPFVNADNGSMTVYVTNTGYAYHREGCSYLRSKNEISLAQAAARGYSPCSRCKPPVFDGELPEITKPSESIKSNSSSYSNSRSSDGNSARSANSKATRVSEDSSSSDPLTIVLTLFLLSYAIFWIVLEIKHKGKRRRW